MLSSPGEKISSKVIIDSISPDFFDSDFCRYWLLSRLHPDQPECLGCHKKIEGRALQGFWEGKKIQCPECGKRFTARAGTILSRLHLDYRDLILLLILFELRFSIMQISKIMNLSRKTIYVYYKRFQLDESCLDE